MRSRARHIKTVPYNETYSECTGGRVITPGKLVVQVTSWPEQRNIVWPTKLSPYDFLAKAALQFGEHNFEKDRRVWLSDEQESQVMNQSEMHLATLQPESKAIRIARLVPKYDFPHTPVWHRSAESSLQFDAGISARTDLKLSQISEMLEYSGLAEVSQLHNAVARHVQQLLDAEICVA